MVFSSSPVVAQVEQSNKTRSTNAISKQSAFELYRIDVEQRIKNAWNSDITVGKKVKVVFQIQKTGRLVHLRMRIPSHLEKVDAAALKAVTDAAPFAPLPEGARSVLDVIFSFDPNRSDGTGYALFPGIGRP